MIFKNVQVDQNVDVQKVISKHVTEPNALNSLNQQPIVWKLKKHVMPISIQDWPLQRIKQDLIKLLESWKVSIVRVFLVERQAVRRAHRLLNF